jgi:diaminohydroxyphosphoribosylaminopyrimidine deaminase / 5-amino-6-(5-phosphoribosylamino)uracil reductase
MNSATPQDNLYMQRCLDLARNGVLHARPNPMVGCVVVHGDTIIGEGYHQKYGGPHAEVHAIRSVKDKEKLKSSTLYVSLEPCAHYGKTPPCADLIVENGIPNVVVGTLDPHSQVAGKGVEKLKKAGITVKTGVLEDACLELNHAFFTFHKKKRPYIILKWAESADGFIDKIRDKEDPIGPNWITNEKSRQLVHKWRAESQAIMVGANTIKKDNPGLDVRTWPGNNPLRVVIDQKGDLPNHARVFHDGIHSLVFSPKTCGSGFTEHVLLQKEEDAIEKVLETLYSKNVISLFVEGGSKLLQQFINKGIWDEARVFRGQAWFNKGIDAPLPPHAYRQFQLVFNTQIIRMYPKTNI